MNRCVTATGPRVLALDINETVSDLTGLVPRLEEVGVPARVLQTWFAATLRDGFALTTAGGYADFATIARAALKALIAAEHISVDRDPDDAAAYVLAGMGELPLHGDVRPGLERLHGARIRLVALTNGSEDTTRQLLESGGAAPYVEQCLSVERVRRWKPAPEAYRIAAEWCGVAPEDVMLVAVHPWDVDGAKRAGLRAAWISRNGAGYPEHLMPPDLPCSGFAELADTVIAALDV
jgi:2-haloacid dehalogenase